MRLFFGLQTADPNSKLANYKENQIMLCSSD
jgi:hypothetical protein